MTLQDKCTSLKLSKKLKELGVPQESEFCWLTEDVQGQEGFEINVLPVNVVNRLKNAGSNIIDRTSAFISDELGKVLPKILYLSYAYELFVQGSGDGYVVGYRNKYLGNLGNVLFIEDSLAEAFGLLVEYLIINGYLDPKEIKL